jgi:hypothetical protein
LEGLGVSERPNTSNEIEDTVTSTDDHPLDLVSNTATKDHTNSHLPEESSFIPPEGSVIDNNTGCYQPVPPVIDTHYTGHQQPVPSEGSVTDSSNTTGYDQPPELAAYSIPKQATSDEDIFDKTSQIYESPQQTASLT